MRVWTKNTKGRTFLRNFSKKSLDIRENVYFTIFCKVLEKPCGQFSRVWAKNTNGWDNFKNILKILEEKSIEKMIFLLFLEKLLLKIEPWKIAPDFYNNFSDFEGGRSRVPLPFQAPMIYLIGNVWIDIIQALKLPRCQNFGENWMATQSLEKYSFDFALLISPYNGISKEI